MNTYINLSLAVMAGLLTLPTSFAQGLFDSTSDGSDGALILRAAPPSRLNFPMVTDANGIFLFSGLGGVNDDETWSYDGENWVELESAVRPSARSEHALAFDSDRGVAVLFGGYIGRLNVEGDTWEFGGSGWIPKAPFQSPPARYQAAMVYDSVNQVVVLFGGRDLSNTPLDDTWEYDGATWTQIPGPGPSARGFHAMAFDSNRARVVLFGGRDLSNIPFDDTWEYNAASNTWAEITGLNPSPSARFGSDMTFDSVNGEMVLFGGSTGSTETWEYNGTRWHRVNTATVPPARSQHGLSYDARPGREKVVMYGGTSGSDLLADVWEYDGADWTRQPFDFNQVIDLNTQPDGIFNHTEIEIGPRVSLSFINHSNNTPVIWLASSNVVIEGSISLDGQAGDDPGIILPNRPAAGPGGGYGGRGGRATSVTLTNVFAGAPGGGLGGGLPGVAENEDGGDAGHSAAGGAPNGGPAYGNLLANPIQGGSGGGGGASNFDNDGGMGGAGGGALLVASSGKITHNGAITANGGAGAVSPAGNGGNGSGGTVRFVSNRIEGNGSINAAGGRVRLEGFFVDLVGVIGPLQTESPPYQVDLANQGVLSIINIEGEVVVNPGGDVNNPDVIFSETGEVSVQVQASANIPAATPITVRITSTAVVQTATVNTTAPGDTVTINFASVPSGVGTIQAFATYTIP